MEQRGLLQVAANAGATVSLATPAIAQTLPTVRWRLASDYPKTLDTIFGASEAVGKRVATATGGRFDMRVFAAGEIVPALTPSLQQPVAWAHLDDPAVTSSYDLPKRAA